MGRYVSLFTVIFGSLFFNNAFGQTVSSPLTSYELTSAVCDFKGECDLPGLHMAVDLVGAAGTKVYSPADGEVVHTRVRDLYGNIVMVESNIDGVNVVFLMAHMRSSDLQVSVGDPVSQGDWLGSLGNYSENGGWGEHLHFGINKGSFAEGTSCSDRWTYAGYESVCGYDDWHHPTEFIEAHIFPTGAESAIAAKATSVGSTNVGSEFNEVHWYAEDDSTYVLQDYKYGAWDWLGIGYNEGFEEAYVMRHGIWNFYTTQGGASNFGVPLGDELDISKNDADVYRFDEYNPSDSYCDTDSLSDLTYCIEEYCGGVPNEYTSMQRFDYATVCWHWTGQGCVTSSPFDYSPYDVTYCSELLAPPYGHVWEAAISSSGEELIIDEMVSDPDYCDTVESGTVNEWLCSLEVGTVDNELFTDSAMDDWPTSPETYNGFSAWLAEGTTFSHNQYGLNDLTAHTDITSDEVDVRLELDSWTQDIAFDIVTDDSNWMICGFEHLQHTDTSVECFLPGNTDSFVSLAFINPVNVIGIYASEDVTINAVYLTQDNDGDGYAEPNADRDDDDITQTVYNEVVLNNWVTSLGGTSYQSEVFEDDSAMGDWPTSPSYYTGFSAWLTEGTTFSHEVYGASDLMVHGSTNREVRLMLNANTQHVALELGGDVQVCGYNVYDSIVACTTAEQTYTDELQFFSYTEPVSYLLISSTSGEIYLDAIYTLPDSDGDGYADGTLDPGEYDDQYLFIDVNQDGVHDPCIRRGTSFYCDTDMDNYHDYVFSYGATSGEYYSNGEGVTVRYGNAYYSDTDSDGSSNSSCTYGTGTNETQRTVWRNTIMVRWTRDLYFDYDMDGVSNASYLEGSGTSDQHYYLAEMDGDSAIEVVIRIGNRFYVDTDQNGTHEWQFNFGDDSVDAEYFFADIDGDGKDDVIRRKDPGTGTANRLRVLYNSSISRTCDTCSYSSDTYFDYGHGLSTD